MRLTVSGLVRDGSGIGVLQRYLYPELERMGVELDLLPTRDRGDAPLARALGLVAGAATVPRGDAFLSLVSPLPLRLPIPTVAYVHDVRWLRTRGRAARAYRQFDFQRTVRRAARVITISEAVAAELRELAPRYQEKLRVVYSGPGQVAPGGGWAQKTPGKVVLVGADRHKQNEAAVRALLLAMPGWASTIVGINLSDEVREMVSKHSAADRFEFHPRLSRADFIAEMGSAEFYLNIGTDEGFGLPYIEALALGCQVVVADQPLTRELLGNAAIYLSARDEAGLAAELADIAPVPEDVRRKRAAAFSWEATARAVLSAIREVSGCPEGRQSELR